MTAAEKEMEIIRKRRDALIAKAAQAKATTAAAAAELATGNGNDNGNGNGNGGRAGNGETGTHPSPRLPPLPIPHSYLPPLGYGEVGIPNGHGLAGYALASSHMGMMNGGNAESPSQFPEMDYRICVSAPPENTLGRCHSCGVNVAIEWRTGPDGAKTLCDNCGVSWFISSPNTSVDAQRGGSLDTYHVQRNHRR